MDDSIDPRLRAAEEQSSTVVHDAPGQHTAVAAPPPPPAAPAPTASPTTTSTLGPSPASIGPPGHSYGATPATPVTAASHPYAPDGETPDGAGHDGAPGDPNDPKRPRACEACRGLKVKCEPEPVDVDGPCKRCRKANRACIITQPTRKRQKKTDSRVAELEKKIDALTASLQATRGVPPTQPLPVGEQNSFNSAQQQHAPTVTREWHPPQATPREPQPQSQYSPEQDSHVSFLPPMVAAGQKRKHTETRESTPEVSKVWPASASNRNEYTTDLVDRGLMTMQQANECFVRYTDHMTQHLPAVVFPAGTTAAEVRKNKPILFLAIIAAASSEMPQVQRQLVKELVQIFADKIVVYGEKSLELVQALQVGVIWYHPPEHFEELKFYQLVHMGAVMAIDIGLGRKRSSSKQKMIPYTWKDHPLRKHPLPEPTTIESRRAWLACYFLASNVAMALHRPNLIRWAPFMTECMDILESSPEAAPSDKYLCHLVWTHRLAEEVGIQFSMDDPNTFVNIAEPKVQYALRGFERDLEKYSDSIPKTEKQPSLLLSFHVLSLYMHEIALYVEKADEIRPPYNADALRDPVPGLNESLTAAHIGALSSCLTAIDGIFETFLSMDVCSIRCLPVFNFVRVAYAVVVLIKMYFSASMPNSELGKVINKDHMKVEEYLEKLLAKFAEVAAADKSRPAAKFIVVLAMLRGWFQKQGKAEPGAPSLPPLGNESTPKPENGTPGPTQQQPPPMPPQPHQPQANEYNPANTPLQLLSEIATGNRGDQTSTATPSNLNTSQAFQNSWMGNTIQPPPTMMFDQTSMGGVMPYLNNSFSADFDYSNLGDGFEQAMGLTFGGFMDPDVGMQGMEYMFDASNNMGGQSAFNYQ
ncbi:hypothetical protein BJ166DRAFT_489392 [Pestalotiopsis sp. NC0098]|nr:hypothetical protein BJ166DRAFT_489392 [Pestalotiopsis sp. NC0098]